MTLTEMANLVCDKIRKTDDESLAIAKSFLNRRYEMIWHDQLWRESMALIKVSVHPTSGTTWEMNLHADGIVMLPFNSLAHIVAVRSEDYALELYHYEDLLRWDVDEFDESGTPVAYVLMRPVVHCAGGGDSGNDDLFIYSSHAADDNQIVKIVSTNVDGVQRTSSPSLAVAVGWSQAVSNFKEILSVSKPETTGTVQLGLDSGSVTLRIMVDDELSCPLRQRLRLLYKPTADFTLSVLGKREWSALTDNESPALTWISNALCAFAQADMLERDRQYGKAQAKQGEGVALLDQARRVQVWQQAHTLRFQPQVENYTPHSISTKGYW